MPSKCRSPPSLRCFLRPCSYCLLFVGNASLEKLITGLQFGSISLLYFSYSGKIEGGRQKIPVVKIAKICTLCKKGEEFEKLKNLWCFQVICFISSFVLPLQLLTKLLSPVKNCLFRFSLFYCWQQPKMSLLVQFSKVGALLGKIALTGKEGKEFQAKRTKLEEYDHLI